MIPIEPIVYDSIAQSLSGAQPHNIALGQILIQLHSLPLSPNAIQTIQQKIQKFTFRQNNLQTNPAIPDIKLLYYILLQMEILRGQNLVQLDDNQMLSEHPVQYIFSIMKHDSPATLLHKAILQSILNSELSKDDATTTTNIQSIIMKMIYHLFQLKIRACNIVAPYQEMMDRHIGSFGDISSFVDEGNLWESILQSDYQIIKYFILGIIVEELHKKQIENCCQLFKTLMNYILSHIPDVSKHMIESASKDHRSLSKTQLSFILHSYNSVKLLHKFHPSSPLPHYENTILIALYELNYPLTQSIVQQYKKYMKKEQNDAIEFVAQIMENVLLDFDANQIMALDFIQLQSPIRKKKWSILGKQQQRKLEHDRMTKKIEQQMRMKQAQAEDEQMFKNEKKLSFSLKVKRMNSLPDINPISKLSHQTVPNKDNAIRKRIITLMESTTEIPSIAAIASKKDNQSKLHRMKSLEGGILLRKSSIGIDRIKTNEEKGIDGRVLAKKKTLKLDQQSKKVIINCDKDSCQKYKKKKTISINLNKEKQVNRSTVQPSKIKSRSIKIQNKMYLPHAPQPQLCFPPKKEPLRLSSNQQSSKFTYQKCKKMSINHHMELQMMLCKRPASEDQKEKEKEKEKEKYKLKEERQKEKARQKQQQSKINLNTITPVTFLQSINNIRSTNTIKNAERKSIESIQSQLEQDSKQDVIITRRINTITLSNNKISTKRLSHTNLKNIFTSKTAQDKLHGFLNKKNDKNKLTLGNFTSNAPTHIKQIIEIYIHGWMSNAVHYERLKNRMPYYRLLNTIKAQLINAQLGKFIINQIPSESGHQIHSSTAYPLIDVKIFYLFGYLFELRVITQKNLIFKLICMERVLCTVFDIDVVQVRQINAIRKIITNRTQQIKKWKLKLFYNLGGIIGFYQINVTKQMKECHQKQEALSISFKYQMNQCTLQTRFPVFSIYNRKKCLAFSLKNYFHRLNEEARIFFEYKTVQEQSNSTEVQFKKKFADLGRFCDYFDNRKIRQTDKERWEYCQRSMKIKGKYIFVKITIIKISQEQYCIVFSDVRSFYLSKFMAVIPCKNLPSLQILTQTSSFQLFCKEFLKSSHLVQSSVVSTLFNRQLHLSSFQTRSLILKYKHPTATLYFMVKITKLEGSCWILLTVQGKGAKWAVMIDGNDIITKDTAIQIGGSSVNEGKRRTNRLLTKQSRGNYSKSKKTVSSKSISKQQTVDTAQLRKIQLKLRQSSQIICQIAGNSLHYPQVANPRSSSTYINHHTNSSILVLGEVPAPSPALILGQTRHPLIPIKSHFYMQIGQRPAVCLQRQKRMLTYSVGKEGVLYVNGYSIANKCSENRSDVHGKLMQQIQNKNSCSCWGHVDGRLAKIFIQESDKIIIKIAKLQKIQVEASQLTLLEFTKIKANKYMLKNSRFKKRILNLAKQKIQNLQKKGLLVRSNDDQY